MKKILWTTMLSTALFAGAACKKDASDKLESAQKELRDQTGDLVEKQREMRQEVAEERQDVNEAQRDMSAAYTEFRLAARERLDRLELRIGELESKGDADSRAAAATLRTERAELATKLDNLSDRAETGWENVKRDTQASLDRLEKDVDARL